MPDSRDEKPIRDVEDVSAALNDLNRTYKVLHDHLIGLGIDYTNKIVGHPMGDNIYRLRDTIMYRFESIRFHLVLLLRTHNQAVAELHSARDENGMPLDTMIMDRSAREQFSVFDSIVFHSISLFDYIGNLIDYLCRKKKRRKLKWNGAANAARDANNIVSESPVAEVVDRLDREWIDKLYSHRSDLIHYKADFGGRTVTHDLMAAQYELRVFAPQRFVNKFSELKELYESHSITLRYVGFWLSERTVESAIEVVRDCLAKLSEARDHQS